MIVDAHNHIWDVPWGNIAPDVNAGNAERFLHHMDENGVQYAIVVCHLDEYDPMNNERALVRAKQFPNRFKIWVNVHLYKPDALDKVKEYVGAPGLVGVSYYMQFSKDDTGEWMKPSPLFDTIAENKLSVNLNLSPAYQARLRELAKDYPTVPFTICHLGGPTQRGEPTPDWDEVLRSAQVPNIYVKISGFSYYSKKNWEYPYTDVLPYIERLYKAFSAQRMLWGSDHPPTMRYMTYRQSLEVIRSHCNFLTEEEKGWVLGGTAERLFELKVE